MEDKKNEDILPGNRSSLNEKHRVEAIHLLPLISTDDDYAVTIFTSHCAGSR